MMRDTQDKLILLKYPKSEIPISTNRFKAVIAWAVAWWWNRIRND